VVFPSNGARPSTSYQCPVTMPERPKNCFTGKKTEIGVLPNEKCI